MSGFAYSWLYYYISTDVEPCNRICSIVDMKQQEGSVPVPKKLELCVQQNNLFLSERFINRTPSVRKS